VAFRNPPKASFFSFLFKSTFLMFVPSLSWQMLSHLLYREEPRHTQKNTFGRVLGCRCVLCRACWLPWVACSPHVRAEMVNALGAKKNGGLFFISFTRSSCQDRLGTNMGKALSKKERRFLAAPKSQGGFRMETCFFAIFAPGVIADRISDEPRGSSSTALLRIAKPSSRLIQELPLFGI
jgi:hypothetical protein